jgi:hypothetical protein
LGIDLRILEDGKTTLGAHRPVEQGIDGHADESRLVSSVGPLRCGRQDVVETGEHVIKVSDLLLLAHRVCQVLFGVWNLISTVSAGLT